MTYNVTCIGLYSTKTLIDDGNVKINSTMIQGQNK